MTNNDEAYSEFRDALIDVLTETDFNPDRRHRPAKARRKVNPRDPRYAEALDRAFDQMKL